MRAIIAGTTHPNDNGTSRADLIRRYCRDGMQVFLVREPRNAYGSTAIAAYLEVPFLLFWKRRVQIGYVKHNAAQKLAPKMDSGIRCRAIVVSHARPDIDEWQRVSIEIIVGCNP